MIRNFLSRQRVNKHRVFTTVQDKPRVAAGKVLSSTPDLIAANWMRTSWGSVDSVPEGNHLEEPLLDQFQDTIAQPHCTGVRSSVVLEPIEVKVELLNLVVVLGLEAGGDERGGSFVRQKLHVTSV